MGAPDPLTRNHVAETASQAPVLGLQSASKAFGAVHALTDVSLELYAGEGVAEACLDLQERRGCDVNILLYCCWLGASGRPTLTAERLRAILKVTDVWQAEIVRPLRQVRRLLRDKPWTETLPETVDAARRRVADA